MKSQQLAYSNGKTHFVGYLAWDDSREGKRPGVIVFPEAFGLGEHAREKANRLAQAGYIALAADLHGGGFVHKDLASVRPVIQGLYANRAEWRSIATAAYDALLAQPLVDSNRVGAIGFCFGGTTCLELARTGGANVRAIATFHSGLNVGLPEDAGRMQSKVLVCHGSEDPLVSQESIDAFMAEMRREKIDWQFIYLGNAVHSFSEPAADERGSPQFAYSKTAEARGWAAMTHLFNETFG
ncbi:dienelactone hydrolase [Steroidobacter agaridevorans]|uniref:Dienelactone hydrolase n=1 Tax=Steroidobacter agaridevorans TaxID=2695856 RepID=A0A829Y945_9GAMM|nr:dienelactone hydrolase family protein [Steroidobacter agaridevorans]GFE79839.1 dienelactone hydrolase [Steroidobacter agaridevorans]GFE90193.1 dienelactone hydrolase [Steroidobacter agaridevorans]